MNTTPISSKKHVNQNASNSGSVTFEKSEKGKQKVKVEKNGQTYWATISVISMEALNLLDRM